MFKKFTKNISFASSIHRSDVHRRFDIFFRKPLKKISENLPTGVAPKYMKNENEKSLKGVQGGKNVSDSNGGVKNAQNTNQPSRTQNEGEAQKTTSLT